MGRQLRIEYPNAFYHIMSHGNGFQWIYNNEEHLSLFKNVLKEVITKYRIRVHAVVLMQNHYHMLLETPEANLSRCMKRFNQEYSRLFNMRIGRKGCIIRDRYKSVLIEKESYYMNVLRYICQNPVRQGIVAKCEDYDGSYLRWLNDKEIGNYIFVEEVRAMFGGGKGWNKKYFKWLNEENETNPQDDSRYRYLLGGEPWLKKIGKRINDNVDNGYVERKKYRELLIDKNKLKKEIAKLGNTERINIIIYTYAKYSGMTIKEIMKMHKLKSEPAVYQRLYRYKKQLRDDPASSKYQNSLENRIRNVKC